jgi:tetratricopeptide (TPR) repeat protein
MMTLNYKFWVSLAVFEIAFGLLVFAVTRQYYIGQAEPAHARQTPMTEVVPARSGNITEADLAKFNLQIPSQALPDDPIEISRLANEYFGNGQYDRAAELYEKLLVYGPDNADTYNNLGLTLHYLGRSTEALQKLHEGIVADATHQRSWLTIGFVNSQMGNIEDARFALNNAIQVGDDEEIRRSATEMLGKLP